MKKRRTVTLIVLLCMLVAALCGAVACGETGTPHDHSFGAWTLTKDPTLTETGTAERSCTANDGAKETKNDVPALSDATVWTKDATASTPATHTADGKDVYKSEYGTVEVTVAKTGEHSWGAWTLTKDPTLTEAGTAERSCTANDGGKDVKNDVPALSDATVWTKDATASTPATHTADGKDVYKSEYGTVEVTVAKTGEHSWGAWTLTKDPTLTDKGTAERSCTANDGGKDVKNDVPALSDATVWTKDATASTPATHTAEGTDVYTSVYGTVEVTVAKTAEHTWGAWSWKDGKEPTEEAGATAVRSCTLSGCTGKEEKTVEKLTDATVWSCETTDPTYNEKGSKVYTSEYGTVTVDIAKLVAPYDGKKYYGGIAVELGDDNGTIKNGAQRITDSWKGEMQLDANGCGTGAGMPFATNTKYRFIMVNYETGEIEIETIAATKVDGSEDEYEYETAQPKTVTAFLDTVSGIIVMPYSSDFTYFHVISPYGAYGGNADITASVSSWGVSALDFGVAFTYTYKVGNDVKTVNFLIQPNKVTFGVSFKDMAGEDVAAAECFNAPQLYVKKGSETLLSIGFDGEGMVALDGFEGVYTDAKLGTVTISGTGSLTAVKNDVTLNGTYTVVDKDAKTLELTITGSDEIVRTYSATIADKTMTSEETPVTVSFNMKDHGNAEQAKEGFKNVEMGLPSPVDPTGEYLFRGWFMEDGLKTPVSDPFKPTEDVTLYAKWVKALKITVYTTHEDEKGDKVELTVGDGDNILDSLKDIDVSYATKAPYAFRGWYYKAPNPDQEDVITDYDFEGGPDDVFSEGDVNIMTIYSHWQYAPYVGEFNGSSVFGQSSGSAADPITIGTDDKISGAFTGTVTHYDEATQILTWEDAEGKTNYFLFDAASGILAYNEDGTDRNYIGDDSYVFSKYATSGNFVKFGVLAEPKHSAAVGERKYYAKFVKIATEDGEKTVFIYDTFIYSDVTIEDGFGTALTIDSIANSKSVVVKDAKGTILLKVASQGSSFAAESNTVDLDKYYGTYTLKEGTGDALKLDGAGDFMLGAAKGTYSETSENTLDAYELNADGVKTAYHVITIEGATYTITTPEVKITFNYGDVENPTGKLENGDYNKNITVELPALTDPAVTYLFRGWFKDDAFETPCKDGLTDEDDAKWAITPTGDEEITLYAKWVQKVTITLHYNDKEQDPTVETLATFGVGDTVTIERPVRTDKAFAGWYTDDTTFEKAWGEFVFETGVTTMRLTEVSYDIYAKWITPPLYYHYYYAYEIEGTNKNGGHFTKTTVDDNHKIDIDYVGNAVGYGYSPFNKNAKVEWVDESSHKLKFLFNPATDDPTTHYAYIDPDSQLIIMNATSDFNGSEYAEKFDEVYLLSYMEKEGGFIASHIRSSYWDSGMVRVISYTSEGGQTYNILVCNNKVYFNVSFKNALGDAASDVDADEAYKAAALYIFDSEGKEIGRWGYDGTTMVELDGNEGTYTLSGNTVDDLPNTLTLNGIDKKVSESASKAQFGADKVGSYEVVSDNVVGVYVDGAYYEATLNKGDGTFTITKPMLSVTFDSDKGLAYAGGTLTNGSYNKNIPVHLPVLTDTDEYVFRGWFTTEDFQENTMLTYDDDGYYLFTPTGDDAITLHAKWLTKVTITVHYGEGLQDKTFTYGQGEAGYPEKPPYTNGKVWDGWYTHETERTEEYLWTEGTAVDESIDLYVKWLEAVPFLGEWSAMEVNNYNGTFYTYDSDGYNFSAEGATDSNSEVRNMEFVKYDPLTGKVTFKKDSSWYYGFYDSANELLVINDSSSSSTEWVLNNDVHVAVRKDTFGDSVSVSKVSGKYLLFGNNSFFVVSGSNRTMSVLIYNSRPYGNVVLKTLDGESIDPTNLSSVTEIKFYDSNNELIVGFAKSGSSWVTLDGYEGDYQKGSGDIDLGSITFNGHGGVTGTEGKTGTYTLVSDQDYTATMTYDGAYYYITLDKAEKTYSATKPMVDVTFTSDKGYAYGEGDTWASSQSLNKNIEITVPALNDTDEYVFRGWYYDAAFENPVDSKYEDGSDFTPGTENGDHLYAKWLKKVTVHVDYQKEGVENYDIVLGEGETATPKEPPLTDGQVLKDWHIGTADGDVWTSGTAVGAEDFTICCEWKDAHALYGEWEGPRFNGSNAGGGTDTSFSSTTFIVDGYGKTSGGYSTVKGTIEDYDPATGKFTITSGSSIYYFAADIKNGVLIAPYNANKPTGYHWYVMVNKAKSQSVTFDASCYWKGTENASVRLIEATLDGDVKMIIYISDGRVWGDVSFVATDAEGNAVALKDVYKDAEKVIIRDSEGKVIEGWKRGDSGLEKMEADGYDGTYTVGDGDTITLDGFGGITTDIDGVQKSGTYAAAVMGASYTFDVYLENGTEYYELTAHNDHDPKDATLNEVKVTITFTITGGTTNLTQEPMTVFKNVPIELPNTSNETEIIAGWYEDEAATETPVSLVDGKYIPTAAVTLYAKAVAKVTLTIVYGSEHGDLPNAVIELPTGTTPDLTQYIPQAQGDYVFDGWYEDAECTTTPYEAAPLTESKSIYCKWKMLEYRIETSGDYAWTESNGVWTSNGADSKSSIMTISIIVAGTISFDWTVDSESRYDWLDIKLASTSELHKSGAGQKGHLDIVVQVGDEITIDYNKDGSGNGSTSDKATISNITFVPAG